MATVRLQQCPSTYTPQLQRLVTAARQQVVTISWEREGEGWGRKRQGGGERDREGERGGSRENERMKNTRNALCRYSLSWHTQAAPSRATVNAPHGMGVCLSSHHWIAQLLQPLVGSLWSWEGFGGAEGPQVWAGETTFHTSACRKRGWNI